MVNHSDKEHQGRFSATWRPLVLKQQHPLQHHSHGLRAAGNVCAQTPAEMLHGNESRKAGKRAK